MKVLVTGAGGYIGRHVVKSLLDMGNDVIALDFDLSGIDARADRRMIDIFEKSSSLFADLDSPDVMIHMAWKDGFRHNSNAHITFLSAHYNFVMDMVKSGLTQVIVMGSMHEVGYFEGMITEETPTNPRSLYGVSKDCLRRSLTLSLSDTDVTLQWVRAFYILGDDEKNASVFTKLIEAEKQGKEKFPFTTGLNQYDFISVDELGFQIASVANQKKVSGVINCCSGKTQRLKDIVQAFIDKNAFSIQLEYGVFPDRPYDSPLIYGDPEKINRILKG
jgi:nucleoside-diphosphate-sugar epimerase